MTIPILSTFRAFRTAASKALATNDVLQIKCAFSNFTSFKRSTKYACCRECLSSATNSKHCGHQGSFQRRGQGSEYRIIEHFRNTPGYIARDKAFKRISTHDANRTTQTRVSMDQKLEFSHCKSSLSVLLIRRLVSFCLGYLSAHSSLHPSTSRFLVENAVGGVYQHSRLILQSIDIRMRKSNNGTLIYPSTTPTRLYIESRNS